MEFRSSQYLVRPLGHTDEIDRIDGVLTSVHLVLCTALMKFIKPLEIGLGTLTRRAIPWSENTFNDKTTVCAEPFHHPACVSEVTAFYVFKGMLEAFFMVFFFGANVGKECSDFRETLFTGNGGEFRIADRP